MQKLLTTFALAGVIICGGGCLSPRATVIDAANDVVRIGPGCTGRVYVWKDGQWQLTGKIRIPEGWYAGPGK